ncbi:hypothetical protein BDR26DRAFT_851068 [Obelidium mucronatum]|nr:hypothetical protein BDR26DRAFT_851068 [Obelidium mucronatum]
MSHLQRFGVQLAVAGVAFVAFEEWRKHNQKIEDEEKAKEEFHKYQQEQIRAQQEHHAKAALAAKKQSVEFASMTAINSPQAVRHAILKAGNDQEKIKSVLGTYLAFERARQTGRMKYLQTNDSITMYNYLMDKLEAANFQVLGNIHTKAGTAEIHIEKYLEVVRIFRLELFTTIFEQCPLVAMFATNLITTSTDQHPTSSNRIELYGEHYPHQAAPHPKLAPGASELSLVRTLFLVDDSVSMRHATQDPTHWDIVRSVLAQIAETITEYDDYGVDILFLNDPSILAGVKDDEWVHAAFDHVEEPHGGTHTGRRIKDILDAYCAVLRYDSTIKPLNIVVFTDGDVNDEMLLWKTIGFNVDKLAKRGYVGHQVGIEFIQIGDDEQAAQSLLKLEAVVDGHQTKHERDVVGVTPSGRIRKMDGKHVLSVIADGIERRMNFVRRRDQSPSRPSPVRGGAQ